MTPTSAVAVLLSLVGIVMLLGSTLSFRGTRRFVQAAAAARATVKQLALSDYESPDGDVYYAAVVAFQDATGRAVEVRWPTGTTPPPYRIGQQVPILYDTRNPQHAVANSFASIWFWVLALLGTGAAFTGGGVALLLVG